MHQTETETEREDITDCINWLYNRVGAIVNILNPPSKYKDNQEIYDIMNSISIELQLDVYFRSVIDIKGEERLEIQATLKDIPFFPILIKRFMDIYGIEMSNKSLFDDEQVGEII